MYFYEFCSLSWSALKNLVFCYDTVKGVVKHYVCPIDPVSQHYIGLVGHEAGSWSKPTHEIGIFLKIGTNPYFWP